ncbi:MAG: TMEM14 family protein [Chlamydiae bacterium]|nr:TMEM14 family protein [Chlamydiota bacterium]
MKIIITTFAYILILLLGGLIGYFRASSLASLIMSILFSISLGISAFIVYLGKAKAFYAILIQIAILLLFFSYRYFSTGKFMPGGFMCLVSLAVLILLLSFGRRFL